MPKKRILLIDDEPDATHLLKLSLETTGDCEVREENRGEHALAAARAFKPDLILLDIMMPTVDGNQVAAALKADEQLKHTPVVLLSVMVTEDAGAPGGTIAGYPAIAKPVSPEEVSRVIEQYLPKEILDNP